MTPEKVNDRLPCGHHRDCLTSSDALECAWCSEIAYADKASKERDAALAEAQAQRLARRVLAEEHRVVLAAAKAMRCQLLPWDQRPEEMHEALFAYDALMHESDGKGKLYIALLRALPYLAHLRESYEDGTPELEDWTLVMEALELLTEKKT